MAEFMFLLQDGSYVTYSSWEEVPEDLNLKHVIKFLPDIAAEPHTDEEHEEIELWNDKLQELMEIERAGSL